VVLKKGAVYVPEHTENLYNSHAEMKVPTPVGADVKGNFHDGVGDQVMYSCDSGGNKSSGGNRVCVQMLSSIWGSALGNGDDPDILQGSVLILDKTNGELVDTKKLYVGDPARKPADAVNYVATNMNRQALMNALCHDRTLAIGNQREEASRGYCLCTAPSARKSSICGNRNAATFALSQVDNEGGNDRYLANALTKTYYRPLDLNLKNRLSDAVNGVVPIKYCDTPARRQQRRSLWGRLTQTQIADDQAALNACAKKLSSRSSSLAVTLSQVYNGDDASDGLGGTFSRVETLVASARAKLGCAPDNARQRATYDSDIRHRTEGTGSGRSTR
jgi:hypothetical protein